MGNMVLFVNIKQESQSVFGEHQG